MILHYSTNFTPKSFLQKKPTASLASSASLSTNLPNIDPSSDVTINQKAQGQEHASAGSLLSAQETEFCATFKMPEEQYFLTKAALLANPWCKIEEQDVIKSKVRKFLVSAGYC
jgi:hypothetical protein